MGGICCKIIANWVEGWPFVSMGEDREKEGFMHYRREISYYDYEKK